MYEMRATAPLELFLFNINSIYICLYVQKDLANRWVVMVLTYSVASQRS